MSIFDRFFNPAWAAIKRLAPDDQFEICLALIASGRIMQGVDDALIDPFERSAKIIDRPELKRENKPIVPLSHGIRMALVRETTVALLSCCCVDRAISSGLKRISNEAFVQLVAVLVLAMTRAANSNATAHSLEDAGYSTSPDEARALCLVRWMNILGLKDSQFVRLINETPFAGQWNDVAAHMVNGCLEASSEIERGGVLKRAQLLCRSLPSEVTDIIVQWSRQVRQAR